MSLRVCIYSLLGKVFELSSEVASSVHITGRRKVNTGLHFLVMSNEEVETQLGARELLKQVITRVVA